MVHKRSEYQNQFKSSIIKTHEPTYLENLTFRHNRRDREFLHTPICWDVEEEEGELSDSNANSNVKIKATKPEEPQYQSLAEILAESSKKNQAFRQNKDKTVKELDIGKISLDCDENINSVSDDKFLLSKSVGKMLQTDDGQKKQIDPHIISDKKGSDEESRLSDFELIEMPEKLTENEEKIKKPSLRKEKKRPKESTGSKNSGPKVIKSTGRPKRPDRQGRIPGATQSPRSAVYSSFDKPPFVSYGAGDIEPNLAIHRTHNVRSSVDVYSQALKAKRLREAEKRRRSREKQRAVEKANALLEKLTSVTPKDQFSWQSEYRKQFHGYEPKEYERAMSSRAVIPHATPINAVHRGGCLIVHVD